MDLDEGIGATTSGGDQVGVSPRWVGGSWRLAVSIILDSNVGSV